MKRLIIGIACLVVSSLAHAGIKDTDVDSSGPNFTKRQFCFHIQGQLTTDVTKKVKWKTPIALKVLSVTATARARSGAAGDAGVDVLVGDGTTQVSILSAQIDLDAAGTTYTGTLASSPTSVAANKVFSIDWNQTNSGTADDVDVCVNVRSYVATE